MLLNFLENSKEIRVINIHKNADILLFIKLLNNYLPSNFFKQFKDDTLHFFYN